MPDPNQQIPAVNPNLIQVPAEKGTLIRIQEEYGFTFSDFEKILNDILRINFNEEKWLLGIFIQIPYTIKTIVHPNGSEYGVNKRKEYINPENIKVEYLYLEGVTLNDGWALDLNSIDLRKNPSAFGVDFNPTRKRIDHYLNFGTDGQVSQYRNGKLSSLRISNSIYKNIGTIRYYEDRDWIEEVFFDRSDLEFMRYYLKYGGYEDIFFSGATINYGNVSNHLLDKARRLEKDTEEVKDPSRCFSLKAEPITTVLDYSNMLEEEDNDNDNVAVDETLSGALQEPLELEQETVPENPETEQIVLPAVFLGAPCPFYWEIVQRVQAGMQSLVGSSQKGREQLFTPDIQYKIHSQLRILLARLNDE
ncbi:MAG: hypothetical protein AAFY76_00935 [Cyanobacteria bacterium J06649_11]